MYALRQKNSLKVLIYDKISPVNHYSILVYPMENAHKSLIIFV